MALATYSDLVTAVAEYLGREGDTTLTSRIPDFITLTEAKLNRALYVPQMEGRDTLTVNILDAEPEFLTLPTDFQSMRWVRLPDVAGRPKLEFLSQDQIGEFRYGRDNVAGQPVYYSILGSSLELLPTPNENYDVEIAYRAKIPALTSSNTTNWLLTLAPDIYLYGALMEASPYTKADGRIAVWAAGLTSAIEDLNRFGNRQSFDNPATIVLPGPTP